MVNPFMKLFYDVYLSHLPTVVPFNYNILDPIGSYKG